jgi:hypothetical protein
MNIKHNPKFDDNKVVKHFSKKDGVPVKYVCTTDIAISDVHIDVFFRATPHPKFGNRYFGLYKDPITFDTMITNADIIEDFTFGMVLNDDNLFEYSEGHHSYKKFENGNMIDGGRNYVRCSGGSVMAIVRDGEFQEIKEG